MGYLTLGFFCLNPESKVNRDTIFRSHALLNHLSDFSFTVTLIVTRKVFDFTLSVTEFLQTKSNDTVVGFDLIASLIDVISNARVNIDFSFGKWYKHALDLAHKLSVDELKPRVCSKQTDRKNHNTNSIADYYKVSQTIPLIDIGLSELKTPFEGRETFIFSGWHIISYIIASSPNWRDHFKDFLKFFKGDFENTSLPTAVYLCVRYVAFICLFLVPKNAQCIKCIKNNMFLISLHCYFVTSLIYLVFICN